MTTANDDRRGRMVTNAGGFEREGERETLENARVGEVWRGSVLIMSPLL